jgi:alkylhydroperoxidase family enzyme
VIDDPRGIAERGPTPRVRALAAIAIAVTETPWQLPAGELSADDRAHAISLAVYFNHLNRIADAVAVPLDYAVEREPSHADRSVPAFARAPSIRATDHVLSPGFAAWRDYVLEREAPLARIDRSLIARHVGGLLGHAVDGPAPSTLRDHALLALAELVTLAPWQLDDAAYAPLRDQGFDDAAVFDVVVTASTAGMCARFA